MKMITCWSCRGTGKTEPFGYHDHGIAIPCPICKGQGVKDKEKPGEEQIIDIFDMLRYGLHG